MSIPPDYFELFNLPVRFGLDMESLDAAYRSVQSQVHPDRFVAGTAAEGRVALPWATRANEAYRALKSPLRRAAYMCERAGAPIDSESNTSMPAEFLTQQLQWREALEEARANLDGGGLKALERTMTSERARLLAAIGDALDINADHARAASLVRPLMFIEKFGAETATAAEAMRERRESA